MRVKFDIFGLVKIFSSEKKILYRIFPKWKGVKTRTSGRKKNMMSNDGIIAEKKEKLSS